MTLTVRNLAPLLGGDELDYQLDGASAFVLDGQAIAEHEFMLNTTLLGEQSLVVKVDAISPLTANSRFEHAIVYRVAIAGDANLDGVVVFEDFLVLAEAFDQEGDWASGDFDDSGRVDFPDFLLLAENFGFNKRQQP